MFTTKRAYYFSFIIILIYYGLLLFYHDNLWIRSFTSSLLPFISGVVAFTWCFKGYRLSIDKEQHFWLLTCIGIIFFTLYHLVLLIFLLLGHIPTLYINSLQLFAYVFFLAGLVYKVKLVTSTVVNGPHTFNIIIFMTVITTVSIHFLISPMFELSNQSIPFTVISLAFPVTNWSIVFVISILFYLFRNVQHKRQTFMIILGFSFQIVGDAGYVYQSINGVFEPGNLLIPLWTIAILIIGLGGLYSQETTEEPKWLTEKMPMNRDSLFPYISVIILLGLYFQSTEWDYNALSTGICILLLLIIGRQLFLVKSNAKLLEEYRYQAFHDPLTGLYNRSKLTEDFKHILKGDQSVALLLVDLDRFKNVNDTLGHHIGDRLLQEAAKRLKSILSHYTRIYRMGGDEFVFILPDATKQKCRATADKILEQFSSPFHIREYDISITPSIGISIHPENGVEPETLLKNADAAMYSAKEKGKNNYQFYCSKLNDTIARKVLLEAELRKAIANSQLHIFYQPKIELKTGRMTGMEGLIRWVHPELGFISPAEFIPIAEETGQIVSIGEWVLMTACQQNKQWQMSGLPALTVSVNVSVRQLQHSHFLQTVKDVLKQSSLAPQFLELEITESIMQNIKESSNILTRLRELGVKISIDDFGTGYSSLHILKELPIDTLKIDKAFIDNITESKSQAMVKAIIDLGLNLNLDIVAEGIEYEHQAQLLSEYSCSYGQGYLYSKPVSVEEFGEMLKSSIAESP